MKPTAKQDKPRDPKTGLFKTSSQLAAELADEKAKVERLETRLRALEAARPTTAPTSTRPTTSTSTTRPAAKPATGRTAAQLLALPHKEAAALDSRAACFKTATAERQEIRAAFESMPAGPQRSAFYDRFRNSLNSAL